MIDETSPTWRSISKWAEEEISNTQLDLETPKLDPEETEFLRGKIAALRNLIDLTAESPEITAVEY